MKIPPEILRTFFYIIFWLIIHETVVIDIKEQMLETGFRISSYNFRGNYSFLNLEIQRSHYIRPKVTVNKGSETIQERKLYEEIYGIRYRYKLLATLSTNGQ